MKKALLIIIPLFFVLAACKDKKAKSKQTTDTIQVIKEDTLKVIKQTTNKDSVILSITKKDSVLLLNTTKQILILLKNKNYSILADFIHPSSGVRFSPYAYVDTIGNADTGRKPDVRFSKEQFINQFKNKRKNKIDWGYYDGSGELMRLNIDKYFERFVYNSDFLNAEKTSVNKAIGRGNDANNLTEVYKGCNFTESYCPICHGGSGEEWFNWCSLRLVYKKHEGKFYLVGIIHAEWTT
ncbi:MAG: hypothetical protein WBP45_12675 [Daejeonella sp.]